jgi:hypothetical protein
MNLGLPVIPEMQLGVKEAFVKLFIAPEGLKTEFPKQSRLPWNEWWAKLSEERYFIKRID